MRRERCGYLVKRRVPSKSTGMTKKGTPNPRRQGRDMTRKTIEEEGFRSGPTFVSINFTARKVEVSHADEIWILADCASVFWVGWAIVRRGWRRYRRRRSSVEAACSTPALFATSDSALRTRHADRKLPRVRAVTLAIAARHACTRKEIRVL